MNGAMQIIVEPQRHNRPKQEESKCKNKGIFWSYSRELTYEKAGDRLFLEYLLKYGYFDNLVLAFK